MTPRELIKGLFPSVVVVSTPGSEKDAIAELAMRPCPDGVHILWVSKEIEEQARQAMALGCTFTSCGPAYVVGAGEVTAQQADPVAADPAVAAIQFALETHSDGLHFLRLWNEGEFDLLRREWPEAPEDIYIGADPLLDAPAAPQAAGGLKAWDTGAHEWWQKRAAQKGGA